MTMLYDMRDILADSAIKGARVWGLAEILAEPETIKAVTRLGDEATFLNALGLSPTEDKELILQLASFLNNDEAVQALNSAGERWKVINVVNTANAILLKMASSLAMDSNPGRVGRLLRAIPIMAGSHSNEIARSLGQTLGVEPVPEDLIVAYGEAFCNRDAAVLAAVDRVIINDGILGQVALELAARLLQQLGYDGSNLDKKSRESLIDCLVILVHSTLEKVEPSHAKING